MQLRFGHQMALGVIGVLAGLWVEFFLGHIVLPDRWLSEWYGMPLVYTFGASLALLYALPFLITTTKKS